jgi:hypothetical protein
MLKIKNDKSVGWKEQNQRCRVKPRKFGGKSFMKRNLAGTGNRYVGNQEPVFGKVT